MFSLDSKMTWKRSTLGGVLFVALACLSYLLGTMYVVTPWFPLMLVRPAWYRWVVDHLVAWYWIFLVALLEMVYGIKVRITGDSIKPGERTLLIMNHRTRLDWMFLWMYLIRRGQLSKEKIILKNELRKIPGAGWGLETACFLFITRRWEEDEKIMKKILDYLSSIGHRTQLLLFPEGTDFTERTRQRSDAYAEKNNLPKYDYVLHPRTKGFVYIAEKLIKEHNLDAIHDITVGYPNGKAQTEADLLAGRFPEEVHFHVRRHPLNTLPNTSGKLEQWCTTLWAQKELQLKEFYQRKKFPDTNVLEGGTPGDPLQELKMKVVLWLSIPFFLTVILVVPYLMVTSTYFFISAVLICAFYIAQRAVYGGAEHFQIDLYNTFHRK
ncbi:lysocardiolipin acyltransferase 1-like isoform X1 [Branchiostoma floridae]|uniref:Lysocardiolipin acyltransferase 1-like isoform X1 n=2 Tax=Branchiostoma floridae TaxID=7739 RepID=A0A9J7HU62_BRAFL|nr:lysocardiolipin acyltransferase 1-like isoform X1 [Branchiostoma floridae]